MLFAALASAPSAELAERARNAIRAAWAISGSATADLLSARASQAMAAGEPALALDLLDAALVMAPNWAGGRHRRAVVHLVDHDLGGAVADLEETLRLDPRHFEAMFAVAAVLEGLGRKREALDRLRIAARLDPRAPDLATWMDRLTIEVEGQEL